MSTDAVDDFHRDVVRTALDVATRYGFVLGGGVAWVLYGLVKRPTEDVDLFADVDGSAGAAVEEIRTALQVAGFDVRDADPDEPDLDLADLFDGFGLDMRELFVVRGDRTIKLSLARLDRHDRPVIMDVGPVMSLDDLVGSKVAALVNRREPRDYIDTAAALQRYTVEQVLALARRQDPGMELADVIEVGRYIDRLSDARFARYGLGPADVAAIRAALAAWPRN